LIDHADVTIVVNNVVEESKLLAEHGLSLLVRFSSPGFQGKLVMDTGQSSLVIMKNMETLGVTLNDLLAVVISHGHYDHTGGLMRLLRSVIAHQYEADPSEHWGRPQARSNQRASRGRPSG
jgi:7,8-dihydropterin-6-yl-methyl-4-(beta-D-ribofuranosyl)aminobenzene 5'-phosphate synthase